MHAGTARLTMNGPLFQYAWLGSRPVALDDVQGMLRFAEQADTGLPLLLGASCKGFAVCPQAERDGVVFYAGAYRRQLETLKHQGIQLVSLLAGTAVGGTYLMHGLVAPIRLAMDGTAFYDTVYPGRCVALEAAQNQGLVTRIVLPEELMETLSEALFGLPQP